MRIQMTLTGMTGLVMHNVRLADPDNHYARAIKELTSKTRKTDADREEIARLQWMGGLYHDKQIGIYVPAWNVVRCFEQAGKITRNGTDIIRSVIPIEDRAPLQHDGPKDPRELSQLPEFTWQTMVNSDPSKPKSGKVPRTRPIFRRWSLSIEAELLEHMMNLEDFVRVAKTAGVSEGLCDARKLGYGRFTVEVKTT